jgi:two-component system sensor kinase FixL
VRKDGAIVESFMNACLIRDVDGRPLMYVGHAEDLTDRLRAEQEAKESQDRLAQVTRLHTLGEMAAGIAHEINQPLTAISTYAQASRRLLESPEPDRERLLETQGKIIRQAERAGNVIRRLRNFVRTRSGDRKRVRIERLIEETVQLAEMDAKFHRLEVRVRLERPLPPILADTIQIQQVLLNLLCNAMEAMENPDCTPRRIELRARHLDREWIQVSVCDRGVGISAEVERQLFTTFFSTKSFGLGLGLSISRSILETHGGRLWFTRNPDRGTTFHIALPAVSGEAGDGE